MDFYDELMVDKSNRHCCDLEDVDNKYNELVKRVGESRLGDVSQKQIGKNQPGKYYRE